MLATMPAIGWVEYLREIFLGIPTHLNSSGLSRSFQKCTVDSYISSILLVTYADEDVDTICRLSVVTSHLHLS